jgi:hypothetical protein
MDMKSAKSHTKISRVVVMALCASAIGTGPLTAGTFLLQGGYQPRTQMGKALLKSRCTPERQAQRKRIGAGMATSGSQMTRLLTVALSVCEAYLAENAETDSAGSGETGEGSRRDWTSPERPGVTGTSTTVGGERLADGTECKKVRTVVYDNGRETRGERTLCKAPGQTSYKPRVA